MPPQSLEQLADAFQRLATQQQQPQQQPQQQQAAQQPLTGNFQSQVQQQPQVSAQSQQMASQLQPYAQKYGQEFKTLVAQRGMKDPGTAEGRQAMFTSFLKAKGYI